MESLALLSAVLIISICACSGMPRTLPMGVEETRGNSNWVPPGILKKLKNPQEPWKFAWAKLKAELWEDELRKNANKHWKTKIVNRIEKAPWADKIPDQENCGVSNAIETLSEYIIGGKNSSKLKYPWMVQVLAPVNGSTAGFPLGNDCSGVIISKEWVLTAKHCVTHAYFQKALFKELPDKTSVAVVQSSFVKAGLDEETVPVDMVMLHPPLLESSDEAPLEDVALLHLKNPVTFGPKIRPICLPGVSAPEVSPGTRCTTAGWGIVSENPDVDAKVLQEVELPIVDWKTCQTVLDKLNTTLSYSAICAGGEGPSTCKGDSGGPLMCASGGRYYVTGITASGIKCGVKGVPVEFMETSKFVDWIYDTMQKPKEEIERELVQ